MRVVHASLDAADDVHWTQREARAREDGWTRRPGGVDLVVGVHGRRAGLEFEFEFDHIDQCSWDVWNSAASRLTAEGSSCRPTIAPGPTRCDTAFTWGAWPGDLAPTPHWPSISGRPR